MAELVFTNNASSLLAASIDDNDTVVQVSASDGALFPSPGAGQFFKLALVNANGDLEICHCTSRAGDLLTVVRGQEGTAAQSWTNGATRAELRVTAGTMQNMVQKSGDQMSGDLNMDDNEIQNAQLTGDTVVTGGQTVGTPMRGTLNDASNELAVPSDGSRATAGGSPLMVLADNLMTLLPVGTIFMWYGSLGALPSGWQNCDGTNGSPDLRGSFPRGAGGALALGAAGGAATATGNTGSGGAHTPTISSDAHALTTNELPAHRHQLRASSGGGITASGTISNGFGLLADYSGGHALAGFVDAPSGAPGSPWMENTGAGAAHSHNVTADPVASHTHDLGSVATIPPYKAVYFIMKVS